MSHGGRRPGAGRKTEHERLTAKEYLRRQSGLSEAGVSEPEAGVSGPDGQASEWPQKVVDRDNPPVGDEPLKRRRPGRPKGARDKPRIVDGVSTGLLRDITEARKNTDAATAFALKIEEHRDALFEQAIRLALGGDKAMIQFLMEHQVGRAATKQAATPETTIIIRSLVPRPKGVGAADPEAGEAVDKERSEAVDKERSEAVDEERSEAVDEERSEAVDEERSEAVDEPAVQVACQRGEDHR